MINSLKSEVSATNIVYAMASRGVNPPTRTSLLVNSFLPGLTPGWKPIGGEKI